MIGDGDSEVEAALRGYWTARDDAANAQRLRNSEDVGGRSGATAGGHLDQIAQLLARRCIEAGAPSARVHYKMLKDDPDFRAGTAVGFTLPGYFRPTKQWDLVVYDEKDVPIVCVELKSQNGPSYGNNANNRAEEAIGNAVDIRRARETGLLPGDPWLGYVFVIEDDERSRLARGQRDRGQFAKDNVFADWSYVGRVQLLCERLVQEGHYDAAWSVATARPNCPDTPKARCAQIWAKNAAHEHRFSWRNLGSGATSDTAFIASMQGVIRKHY